MKTHPNPAVGQMAMRALLARALLVYGVLHTSLSTPVTLVIRWALLNSKEGRFQ